MVFGFTKNRKIIEVRQTMGRFVNRTFTNSMHAIPAHEELRSESRHNRLLPLLFTPVLETESELIEHLGPAFSQDISSEGFAMISYGPIAADTILAVITDSVEMALLHCEIRHCRHIGYGYHIRGIKVLEKLRWAPFKKLREAVELQNQKFQTNQLEEALA